VLGKGDDAGSVEVDVQNGDVHVVLLERTKSSLQIRRGRHHPTAVRVEKKAEGVRHDVVILDDEDASAR
jgi:hypothetical protein